MSSNAQLLGLAAAAVSVGVLYVVVHEKRRKSKKAAKALRDQPITKEVLLSILNMAADKSKAVIERIRVEVKKLQQAKGISDEQAMMVFQQNFEHSLDQLIQVIRQQFGVSETAMDASFKQHQRDPEVQAAIQNMRQLSNPQGSGAGSSAAAAGVGSSAGGATEPLPASLTRERLKEIMKFNAAMLEKHLKPIKEAVAAAKRQGMQPQINQEDLFQVQRSISAEVSTKYGVSDEQVMRAVEEYGAKSDPAFKDILARIANTLNESLA